MQVNVRRSEVVRNGFTTDDGWQLTFDSFIWPLLGFLFMPWTTLMYAVINLNGLQGLQGFDWLWIGLAVVADLGMYVGGGYGNRERIRV